MRAAFIEKHLPVKGLRIAEIGALENPTFRREDGFDIRFIDYASRDQLLADHANKLRFSAERMVNVDYALTGDYSRQIKERFDLVIANHVIEHVPDTIRWLADIAGILAPKGHLFLAVPDRRFTFDHLRRESEVTDLLRAYDAGKTRPDRADIFSHFYYFREVKYADFANGAAAKKLDTPRSTITQAAATADRLSKRAYASVHCHVFTLDSFLRLHGELAALHLMPFDISAQDVYRGEFHVLMDKR